MRYFLLALLCVTCLASSYGQAGTNSYGKIQVTITKESRKKIDAQVEILSASRVAMLPGCDLLRNT